MRLSTVIGTDVNENIVYSGQNDDHPGLNRFALRIKKEDMHFVSNEYNINNINYLTSSIRIRYRQPLQKGTIYVKKDFIYILFEEKQRGITPGQFAAIYEGEELIASGVIDC